MNHELIEQREQNDACIDSAESRKKKVKCQLTFKNEDQELNRVAEFMESVCDELQLDMHVAMKLQLAMEEMVTNVIFYAYPEGTTADITLTAESDGQELTFVLSDNGKPFDPTAKEDADLDVNPMDREQGGMGILIVKNIMNEVSYQRLGEENRLTMKKKI